jgi:pyruvate,orthophosphate dikinase
MLMAKWVYTFGGGEAEGSAAMKALLGGKGANLAEMASLGLPVPPGFTITTEVCTWFYANGQSYPPDLKSEVDAALEQMAQATGRRFGDPVNPLLVSVRSGARASMPGMMDTVLNLGLNDQTVAAIAAAADPRFAYDSYRRFIQMYGNVVLGVEHHEFEAILEIERSAEGLSSTPTWMRMPGPRSSNSTKPPLRSISEGRFRKIPTTSSGAPSGPSSVPG